jgi:phenylalanine-4-hydroxylase
MESSKSDGESKMVIIFSPSDTHHRSGALAKMLKVFDDHKINLTHIESRSSTRVEGYEFMVELDPSENSENPELNAALEVLREKSSYFQVISRDHIDNKTIEPDVVPWFPQRIRDLDRFANQILSYGAELDADHPGISKNFFNKMDTKISNKLQVSRILSTAKDASISPILHSITNMDNR